LSGSNAPHATVDALRVLVMSLGYMLYLAAFVGLALAASAFFRSVRTALIVLLGFWVANCLIAPRVAADVSERMAPVPSAAQFWTKIADDLRNGLDGHDSQDQRARQLLDNTLEQYGVARVEDLPVNFAGLSLQAGEQHSDRVFDNHFNGLWDGFEQQSRIQQWIGLVAPLLAVRSLSMGMAASDFAHHRRFARAAEDYRREMVKTLNLDIAYNSKPGERYLQDEKLWSQVPDFAYAPPSASWAMARQTGSSTALVAWLVASGLFALLAVRRIRVN
jgi:ABC-2 type transport system permease protein